MIYFAAKENVNFGRPLTHYCGEVIYSSANPLRILDALALVINTEHFAEKKKKKKKKI